MCVSQAPVLSLTRQVRIVADYGAVPLTRSGAAALGRATSRIIILVMAEDIKVFKGRRSQGSVPRG
jgi:hypothetical protein